MVLGKKSPALPWAPAGAHPAAGASNAQGSQSQKLPRILCWRCPAHQGHPCCGNVTAVQPERFAQDPAWIFTSFAPIISIGTFFIAGSPAASFAWWKQTIKQKLSLRTSLKGKEHTVLAHQAMRRSATTSVAACVGSHPGTATRSCHRWGQKWDFLGCTRHRWARLPAQAPSWICPAVGCASLAGRNCGPGHKARH